MGKALGNIDFPPIIYYLPRAIPTRSADFLNQHKDKTVYKRLQKIFARFLPSIFKTFFFVNLRLYMLLIIEKSFMITADTQYYAWFVF